MERSSTLRSNVVRTHVLLPKELVEAIDRRVGPRRRSEFIAAAVERELDIEERLRLFHEFAGSLKDVDIPGWETPESTTEWVRAQRRIGTNPREEATAEDRAS